MVNKDDDGYDDFAGFNLPQDVKKAVEMHAKIEGVKPAVIYRKAIVKYLKEKGVLEQDKNYL